MPARARFPRWPAAPLGAAALLLVAIGCGAPAPTRTTLTWLVGQVEPPFDPAGPADPVRWTLERLIGEGLVAIDSTGRIAQGAARRWEVTPDGLTYTFHLRPGMRFADGRDCTSADFRRAIEAGLNRVDHSTYAWMLSPIVGVDRVRAGRPLPPLGIATPDDHTLVLRLARADPTLLHKLALPGASTPWRPGGEHGGWGGGSGGYRVVARQPGRHLVLARRAEGTGPDTVRVEFAVNAARARDLLRHERADLVWPVPNGMRGQPLPAEYRTVLQASRPARRLWLVMRPELPPTTRIEARRALAHGLNRPAILAALDIRAGEVDAWLTGSPPLELPHRDPGAVREWLERGRLGRSMHVVMAYAADGVGAEIVRGMQTEWAGVALDVELRPLRRASMRAEALRRGGAQLLLIDAQPPFDDAVAEMAELVQPRNSPPIGTFRTGWATREFDRWIGPQPPETPFDLEQAQRRLGEDLVAIPLARLPWVWIVRNAGPRVGGHPRYGPEIEPRMPVLPMAHQSR
jgi:ABC-type transport system substrate-binding protein